MLLVAFAFIQTAANAQPWSQLGMDIDGEAANNESGNTVSLSADGLSLAIGAPRNNGNGSNAGHMRVYKLQLGVCKLQGKLQ